MTEVGPDPVFGTHIGDAAAGVEATALRRGTPGAFEEAAHELARIQRLANRLGAGVTVTIALSNAIRRMHRLVDNPELRAEILSAVGLTPEVPSPPPGDEPPGSVPLDARHALELVLDLASQNVVEDAEVAAEAARQREAIQIVEDAVLAGMP